MKFMNTRATRHTQAALLFLSLLLAPLLVQAKDVSFEWTAVPEPLTGYKLYYKAGGESGPPWTGTGLNQEGSPIILGKVTSHTVTGLAPDATYHFVLSAFNADGESGYSQVVTVSPDSDVAPVILNISIK